MKHAYIQFIRYASDNLFKYNNDEITPQAFFTGFIVSLYSYNTKFDVLFSTSVRE